jgi:hypothetical protein
VLEISVDFLDIFFVVVEVYNGKHIIIAKEVLVCYLVAYKFLRFFFFFFFLSWQMIRYLMKAFNS